MSQPERRRRGARAALMACQSHGGTPVAGPSIYRHEPTLRHEMLAASAGFGKTFRLVSRLLAVLARAHRRGEPPRPSALVALTFNRAAAGEIFDEFVKRLAAAAVSPAGAAKECGQNPYLAAAPLSREAFAALLSAVLRAMHQSPIGTIDAFFVRVLRCHAPELGLAPAFTIMDDYERSRHGVQRLRDVLLEAGAREAVAPLAEAFKQATFGTQEKSLHRCLARFVDTGHSLFRQAGGQDTWGGATAIWPVGESPLPPPDATPADQLMRCTELAERALADGDSAPCNPAQQELWDDFFESCRQLARGAAAPIHKTSLFPKLLAVLPELLDHDTQVTVARRKVQLQGTAAATLSCLLQAAVGALIQRRVRTTQGVYHILKRYDQIHTREVRGTGCLDFDDVTRLLARAHAQRGGLGDAIDYRLDATLHHWALDEFQDTSRPQWSVLHNLADEVIQSPPEERTFFVVGDIKQAIYAWRGGDSRLMNEIYRGYGPPGSNPLMRGNLEKSYRSAPEVLAVVNTVFPALEKAGVTPEVAAEWRQAGSWLLHRTARDIGGYAALLELPKSPGHASGRDRENRTRLTARIVKSLNPGRRRHPDGSPLTVAVLVRTNAQGTAVTEALREQGVDARWDGESAIADSAVVRQSLSLLRLAAHPGDEAAARHAAMGVFGQGQESAQAMRRVRRLGAWLRGELPRQGMYACLRRLLARVEQAGCHWSAFTRSRLDSLLEAALRYDASGRWDPLDFCDFVAAHTVRDMPAENAVRVLTMHRSKGLGFDVVILPELVDALASSHRPGLAYCPPELSATGREWVFDLPVKDVCQADPVLREFCAQNTHREVFESLCLLYVALTRAKSGLFLITTAPGKSSSALTFSRVVRETLSPADSEAPGGETPWDQARIWSAGNPAWLDKVAPLTPHPARQEPQGECRQARPGESRRRSHGASTNPSRQHLPCVAGSDLFISGGPIPLTAGTGVHDLFRRIGWLDERSVSDVLHGATDRRNALPGEALTRQARGWVRTCLESPEVRPWFVRPPGPVRLWREQPFDVVMDGQRIVGVVDRAVLHLGPDAQVEAVDILDYKTDACPDSQAEQEIVTAYTPQMQLYSRALAHLCGVPRERVSCWLVLVRCGHVLPVTSPTVDA